MVHSSSTKALGIAICMRDGGNNIELGKYEAIISAAQKHFLPDITDHSNHRAWLNTTLFRR